MKQFDPPIVLAWLFIAAMIVGWAITTSQAADLNRKSDYQRPTFDQRFGSFCIYDTTKQSQMEALIGAARNDKR